MRTINWSTVEELGKISDRQLAKKLGVNKSTVRDARIRLGILPFGEAFSTEAYEKTKKQKPKSKAKPRSHHKKPAVTTEPAVTAEPEPIEQTFDMSSAAIDSVTEDDTKRIKQLLADRANHNADRKAERRKERDEERREAQGRSTTDNGKFGKSNNPERAIFIAMQRLLKRSIVSLRTYGSSHFELCEDIATVLEAYDKLMEEIERANNPNAFEKIALRIRAA